MDKWVPFADLRNARPFAPAYQIGETDVFSATFSGHEKELREAFQKLDGRELPQGDVGYAVSIADSGIKRLAELAGVPLRGKSFQMR